MDLDLGFSWGLHPIEVGSPMKKQKLGESITNHEQSVGSFDYVRLRLAPNMAHNEKVCNWFDELPWYFHPDGSIFHTFYSATASASTSSSIGCCFDDTDFVIEYQLKKITKMVRLNYLNEPEQVAKLEDVSDNSSPMETRAESFISSE